MHSVVSVDPWDQVRIKWQEQNEMQRAGRPISPMFPRGLTTRAERGGFNRLGIPTGPGPGEFPLVFVISA
jgi:hypothetical protein